MQVTSLMSEKHPQPVIRLSSQITHLVALVLSIVAAYFMTIQSLRLELAAKAENVMVETLDKKLTSFEVFIREGVVGKEQFYEFSKDVEARLIRIEGHLTDNSGESIGKR